MATGLSKISDAGATVKPINTSNYDIIRIALERNIDMRSMIVDLDIDCFEALKIYEKFGFDETAFDHSYYEVRLEAYRALGWTKKAFKDVDASIRRKAYDELGFTKKALTDPDDNIRAGALDYFHNQRLDNNPKIRKNAIAKFDELFRLSELERL